MDPFIKIFNDKIEIFNPGKLPKGITIDKLLSGDYISIPRNRQIAEMFKEAGLIEKYGSGIKRVRDEFKKMNGRLPDIKEIGGGFMVTVYPTTPQKTPQKDSANKGVHEAGSLSSRILLCISENPEITRREIAGLLKISTETVKEYIEKLKKAGKLQRKGSRRSGYWAVKK